VCHQPIWTIWGQSTENNQGKTAEGSKFRESEPPPRLLASLKMVTSPLNIAPFVIPHGRRALWMVQISINETHYNNSARVMRNENGECRGFGFVSYQTPEQDWFLNLQIS